MWVTNEGKEQGGPLAWMWICNFEIHPEDAFLWWWPKVLAIKQVVIPYFACDNAYLLAQCWLAFTILVIYLEAYYVVILLQFMKLPQA